MNKKIHYIPLILILCFSMVFFVYPMRTIGLSDEAQGYIDYLSDKYGDDSSEPDSSVSLNIITSPSVSPLVYGGVDPEGDLVFGASTNWDLSDPIYIAEDNVTVIVIPTSNLTYSGSSSPAPTTNGGGNGDNGSNDNGPAPSGGCTQPEPEPEPEPESESEQEEPTIVATVTYYRGWKCSRNISCSAGSEYCKECVYSRLWRGSSGLYGTQSACEANCQYKCKCEPYREPSIQAPRYSCNLSTRRCEMDIAKGLFTSSSQCRSYCVAGGSRGYNCDTTTYQCVGPVSRGIFSSRSECSRYCQEPPPRYTCNTENWTCEVGSNGVYASLSDCQSDCSNKCVCVKCSSSGPCEKECVDNIACNNGVPPPEVIVSEDCTITKFELPKRAWVDIKTTAYWSTNNCDTAEINCISDDCSDEVQNLSGSVEVGFDQSKNFTISAPGTYRYELEACGPNNCDTYVDEIAFGGTGDPYIEIEALYLPWWQEIIPILPDNLQGFLRGLII